MAGYVDVVVGNSRELSAEGAANLLLLNNGGTFSEAIELPGGKTFTSCVALGDVNGDGTRVRQVFGL